MQISSYLSTCAHLVRLAMRPALDSVAPGECRTALFVLVSCASIVKFVETGPKLVR